MSDYHINVFYSDEDGGYIADIPDLDACSAFGDTPNRPSRRSSGRRPLGSRQRKKRENRSPHRATGP